jgi:ABC-type dipeptide/oligopeptide/nickel transport system ATPase component
VGDGVAVRLQAAYAPGEIALYGELRADEHLQWFLRGRESNAWQRALEYAQRLELPLRKRVRTYSHGMKRQLMLCAALAPQVPVRILDEPTEGLDPSKRGAVLQLLQEDAARGTAILLSSHHLGEVDRVCARLVFVQAGRIIANETAATVRERAARLVRLSFAATVAEDSVKQTLQSLGGATLSSMVVEDQLRVSAQVAGEPREWLARALALPALPAPTTIEHGRLSLAELYRELYGVEGC